MPPAFRLSALMLLSLALIGPHAAAEPPHAAEARALGAQVADSVLKEFLTSLKGALNQGGATHAVSFCNVHAPGLAEKLTAQLPPGVTFRRTSEKIRNPANQPDKLDLQALLHFEQEFAATGMLPVSLLQQVETEEFKGFRYYAPIKVAPLCLSCHGESATLPPAVQELLRERYPRDEATGYQSGDFRGLLRVAIPDSALAAARQTRNEISNSPGTAPTP